VAYSLWHPTSLASYEQSKKCCQMQSEWQLLCASMNRLKGQGREAGVWSNTFYVAT